MLSSGNKGFDGDDSAASTEEADILDRSRIRRREIMMLRLGKKPYGVFRGLKDALAIGILFWVMTIMKAKTWRQR